MILLARLIPNRNSDYCLLAQLLKYEIRDRVCSASKSIMYSAYHYNLQNVLDAMAA